MKNNFKRQEKEFANIIDVSFCNREDSFPVSNYFT